METYTYEETIKTPEPKKTRKRKTALKVAALALGCSLLGGAVGAGGTAVTGLALYTFYKPAITSEKETAIEGDTYTLTINRSGEIIEVEVTLSFKKQSALPEKEKAPEGEQQMQNPFMNGGFPEGDFSGENFPKDFMPNRKN